MTLTLSETQRLQLAHFVAVQLLLTRGQYENFVHMVRSLGEVIEDNGWQFRFPGDYEFYFKDPNLNNRLKASSLDMLIYPEDIISALINKEWLLIESIDSDKFYISDNPVSMSNDLNVSHGDNIGLLCRGVQIYLPISDRLTLAIVCGSNFKSLRNERELIYKYIISNIKVDGVDFFSRLDFIKSNLDSRLVMAEPERVKDLNLLQVWSAEQFIYSGSQIFDLCREALVKSPGLKSGPRGTVLWK